MSPEALPRGWLGTAQLVGWVCGCTGLALTDDAQTGVHGHFAICPGLFEISLSFRPISVRAFWCSVRHVQSLFGMRAPESVERLYKRELGGGALLDIGVYPLSFIQVTPRNSHIHRSALCCP